MQSKHSRRWRRTKTGSRVKVRKRLLNINWLLHRSKISHLATTTKWVFLLSMLTTVTSLCNMINTNILINHKCSLKVSMIRLTKHKRPIERRRTSYFSLCLNTMKTWLTLKATSSTSTSVKALSNSMSRVNCSLVRKHLKIRKRYRHSSSISSHWIIVRW